MTIVPATRGWHWIMRGVALVGRAPLGWMVVSMTYWLVMVLVSRLPYLGLLVALLITPALAVSFMAICRGLDRGGRGADLTLVADGFRRNLTALVTLGGVYLAVTLAIFAASGIADGGALARLTLSGRGRAGAEGGFAGAVALALALSIPVQLAFWFAPVLAAWHGMPAAKALFFSFFAAMRNWRAFLVYAVAGVAALGILMAVIFNVQRAQAGPQIVPTLVFLLLVAFIPVYYASAYASYRDIFPESAGEGTPANSENT
jgi:hypothetical protein